jgi:hypothetical protein
MMTPFLQDLPKCGATCPTCEQFAKVYRRRLSSGSVRGLIWLSRNSDEEFIHVNSVAPRQTVTSGGYFALLAHWGLIEQKHNDDATKRCSGFWRMTPLGRNFVWGYALVSSHVLLYDNHVLGFDGPKIDIREALGAKFSYEELMGSR